MLVLRSEEPESTFIGYLDALERRFPVKERWLVVALDEFEEVEIRSEQGIFRPDLLNYLRSLMQHRRWMALILAGSHRLEEMRRDYRHPLMETARTVFVDYLDEEAARDFLTNPWDDFPLNYDADTLAKLIRETGGHPMLLQHVGWFLIERFNERLKRDPDTPLRITLADARWAVERVLGASKYFEALFNSLTPNGKAVVCALARQMARRNTYVAKDALPAATDEDWKHLTARHIVEEDKTGLRVRLRLNLLRRWLREQNC